jgi:hypothetical protein
MTKQINKSSGPGHNPSSDQSCVQLLDNALKVTEFAGKMLNEIRGKVTGDQFPDDAAKTESHIEPLQSGLYKLVARLNGIASELSLIDTAL